MNSPDRSKLPLCNHLRNHRTKIRVVWRILLSVLIAPLLSCDSIHLAYLGRSDCRAFAKARYVAYSNGGSILRTNHYLNANSHHRLVIDGPCISACALVLSHRNVCWTRHASFWIHGATLDGVASKPATAVYEALLPTALVRRLPVIRTPNKYYIYTGRQMAMILHRDLCN